MRASHNFLTHSHRSRVSHRNHQSILCCVCACIARRMRTLARFRKMTVHTFDFWLLMFFFCLFAISFSIRINFHSWIVLCVRCHFLNFCHTFYLLWLGIESAFVFVLSVLLLLIWLVCVCACSFISSALFQCFSLVFILPTHSNCFIHVMFGWFFCSLKFSSDHHCTCAHAKCDICVWYKCQTAQKKKLLCVSSCRFKDKNLSRKKWVLCVCVCCLWQTKTKSRKRRATHWWKWKRERRYKNVTSIKCCSINIFSIYSFFCQKMCAAVVVGAAAATVVVMDV